MNKNLKNIFNKFKIFKSKEEIEQELKDKYTKAAKEIYDTNEKQKAELKEKFLNKLLEKTKEYNENKPEEEVVEDVKNDQTDGSL